MFASVILGIYTFEKLRIRKRVKEQETEIRKYGHLKLTFEALVNLIFEILKMIHLEIVDVKIDNLDTQKMNPQHTDSQPCTRPPSWGTQ